jgi:hypothetical protein
MDAVLWTQPPLELPDNIAALIPTRACCEFARWPHRRRRLSDYLERDSEVIPDETPWRLLSNPVLLAAISNPDANKLGIIKAAYTLGGVPARWATPLNWEKTRCLFAICEPAATSLLFASLLVSSKFLSETGVRLVVSLLQLLVAVIPVLVHTSLSAGSSRGNAMVARLRHDHLTEQDRCSGGFEYNRVKVMECLLFSGQQTRKAQRQRPS